MGSVTIDMGLQASRKAEIFHSWLRDNPGISVVFNRQLPALAYLVTPFYANEAAKACRQRHHKTAGDANAREDNLLWYKAFRKMAWIARGQPKAQ